MPLIRSGDVELNLGSKKPSSFSFFHKMIDGTTAHNFSEMDLIQFDTFTHNTDIIFLCKIFLD